jgi:antitoxin component of RelBE/YafQ-DinJ toxin-antitoxin module
MTRKTTSMKLDTNVWASAKKKAIDLGIDVSDYVENLLRADLSTKKAK